MIIYYLITKVNTFIKIMLIFVILKLLCAAVSINIA